MGVYIFLDIDAEAIEPAAWRGFYVQARDFLMQHPDGLVGLRRQTIDCNGQRVRRWVYSTELEQDEAEPSQRHLRVSGDRSSLKTAEAFRLFEDISHYRRSTASANQPNSDSASASASASSSSSETAANFITEALADGINGNVFSDKTQGYPYHQAILAVGMLAEARFPGRALVRGDLSVAQCQAAASLLEEIIGVSVPLPLMVDGDRLYETLVGEAPTVERLQHLVNVSPLEEAGVEILHRRAPRPLQLEWLASRIAHYEGRVTLGVITALRHWLNVTEDLDGLIEALSSGLAGVRLAPADLASALVSTGVTLEPQRAAGLEGLDRPDAAPDSIYSQFGNAMLDASGMSARNCRYRLGQEPVIARLTERFPMQQAAIGDTLRQQTETLQAGLEKLGTWAASVREKADRDPEAGDGESFLDEPVDGALSAHQELLLRELGVKVGAIWDDLRAGLAERIGDGIEQRRLMLMRVLEHRQIALTERAWGWIDAEQEEPYLTLLIVIAGDEDPSKLFANMRRGILEHRSLCSSLLGYIR